MDLYYTVLSAPCQSVYMVAKYLGLDVNLRYVNAREYMKQAACKYHLRNCIPTLVDGNFVLSESFLLQSSHHDVPGEQIRS